MYLLVCNLPPFWLAYEETELQSQEHKLDFDDGGADILEGKEYSYF